MPRATPGPAQTDSPAAPAGAAAGTDRRWRSFPISQVEERDFKIDSLKWLKDESLDDADGLPDPEEIAQEAVFELEGAVEGLTAIIDFLEDGNKQVAALTRESVTRG